MLLKFQPITINNLTKMKKQIFLSAALVALSLASLTSCKKDNDDAVNPTKQTCTLDRKIAGTDSTQLSYDSDNRVTKKQRFSAGASQEYTLYTYSSNKIVEKNYNASGTLTSQVDYKLNGNNNAEYSVYTTDVSDYSNADTTWYTYDSGKHNTRRVTKNTTVIIAPISTYDTTWYTYTGENLTKKEVKTNNAAIVTTVYSYGSDNAYSEFLAPESSTARNLYGDYSEKLPISKTEGSTTTSYVYEFNSEGYATRKKEVVAAATNSDERYNYNCK